MQTFLPLATTDYQQIAKTLDNKRLFKQALEGWQILLNLLELDPEGNHRKPKGWSNHPAVKMWRGAELELYKYVTTMNTEWLGRGFNSSLGDKLARTIQVAHENLLVSDSEDSPTWMRDTELFEKIASSHRQALLKKDYGWYSNFAWSEDSGTEPDGYDYVWPNN